MKLQKSVGSFHDLHSRMDVGAFHSPVGNTVDSDSRCDLDKKGSLRFQRKITLTDRSQKCRHLWLQNIQVSEGTNFYHNLSFLFALAGGNGNSHSGLKVARI